MSTARADAPAFELKPYKSLDNATLQQRIDACAPQDGLAAADPGPPLSAGRSDRPVRSGAATATASAKWRPSSSDCRCIVFCGVHFMAETADILANRPEKLAERDGVRVPVMLPDLAAGCSMADMAAIHQIEDAWDRSGRSDRHRRHHARHVHQLGRQPEGILSAGTAASCARRATPKPRSTGRSSAPAA